MALGEFDWIARLHKAFPVPSGGILGIGDDCAVLPFSALSASPAADRPDGELLVSTDLLTEGVHFRLEDLTPWQLGWKSLAVNISDIAAMGGVPKGFFLSIAFPAAEGESACSAGHTRLDEAWMDEFIRGLKDIAGQYGVALLGGDTSRSIGPLTINITILGTSTKGMSVKRAESRLGDLICVSGTLGDSAAGLKVLLEKGRSEYASPLPKGDSAAFDGALARLVRRHFEPQPRVSLGQALAAMPGMGAMMDLSDGLAADLPHMLEASAQALGASTGMSQAPLGAIIDVAKIPLSDDLRTVCSENAWDALSLALEGGEDYELLFTCRPDAPLDRIRTEGVPALTVIGRVTDTPGIVWKGTDRSFSGFRHF